MQRSLDAGMQSQARGLCHHEGTGFDWFTRCLLIGLVIGLGVNAVSYFFLSDGIVDLTVGDNRVSEEIGFPNVFWSDTATPTASYAVSVPYADKNGLIDYSSLGWNLMYFLVPGALIGGIAVFIRRRLNALTHHRHQRHLESRLAGGYFQITMRGILLVTTAVAASFAVWSQLGSIDRKPVDSSNIASMGYNSTTKTLEVEFQSGSVYRYFQVQPKVYREFESADSLGRYLSKNIRDKFPYEKASVMKTSMVYLEILVLGPLYLFTFAILLNRFRWKTKVTLAAMLGAVLICVCMSSPVRVDMNPDRVLMGLFIFWMPQIALFVLLQSVLFAAQAFFLKKI